MLVHGEIGVAPPVTLYCSFANGTVSKPISAIIWYSRTRFTGKDETLTSSKYLPFFEACLTAKQFEEIREDIVDGVAFFEQLLDEHPNLIAKLPLHELWRLYPEERLMLLIHHPEEADVLRQTLEGNDVWATSVWKLRVQIQRGAAKLCPWETLTASQKRYMSLKSATLKKIIEKQQTPKK